MAGKRKKALGALCVCIVIGSVVGYDVMDSSVHGNPPPLTTANAAEVQTNTAETADVPLPAENRDAFIEKPAPNSDEEMKALETMEPVSETGTLALYLNPSTAEFAVKDKRDGYVWFSNPAGRESDPLASPLYKSELSSQITLAYYNKRGQVSILHSYEDSVKNKQFKIDRTERGIKVVYEIGKPAGKMDGIPKAISKDRMEQLILTKLRSEDERSKVLDRFKFDEEKQTYELRKIQDYVAEELAALLESAGYTSEQAAEDNNANGAGGAADEENAQFTVPVEYALDGDQFVATIPVNEVKYPKTYPLASLQLLKYFGAANDRKSGYIFVPDGSGALIRLNNRRLTADPYVQPIYGEDAALNVTEKLQQNEPSRLPVFGMKQGGRALLGIIEGGDALASVTADISGRYHAYNSVGSRFGIVAMDFYKLQSGPRSSSVPMYQTKTYEGDLSVRYAFLSGRSADYTGMAAAYRGYLVRKYNLKKLEREADIPFILELEGAFRKRKTFLGIPYHSTESLTTYDEARKLLEMLKDKNVGNVALRYVGWFNGGIKHGSPANIRLESILGGRTKFGELTDYAKKHHIGFFPDVAFLQNYESEANAAEFMARKKARIYAYDPVMHFRSLSKFSHYLLAPAKLSGIVDGFLSDYERLGIQGVSLRDMGDEMHSDFHPSRPVDRMGTRGLIAGEAAKINKRAGSIMVSGGNAYALQGTSIIVNAPSRSSRLNITDEDVPFYQIALHGYFDYAGLPFNRDEDQNPRLSMLKALETGSSVYYRWFYSKPSVIKETEYNHLYGLYYQDWFDEAVEIYEEANAVLKDVRNAAITGHRKLADGVLETTYENGKTIIVNYNRTPVSVKGLRIGAESYEVVSSGIAKGGE